MDKKLISVIIPVYNVDKFVKDAILSICNQTYKNIEIIVVDDCSTDSTYNIVENLAKHDIRIKLFKNSKNSKIVKTLNFALEQANGDFIARMDGDDISSPERLEKQLNFLIENKKFYLIGSYIITIDESGEIIGKQKMPTNEFDISKTLKYVSPVSHIWLARREVYTWLNGYREIPGAEDYDFLLRMHSKGLLFTNLDSYEYSVRIRDGNTTSTIGFNQRLMSNYVVDLYNMRKQNNSDDYSLESVQNYIDRNQRYKDNFDKSNQLLRTALMAKAQRKFFKMFIFLLMSALKSKFQSQYLFKRTIFKFISKA